MNTYNVTVKHDKGRQTIKTFARTEEQAVQNIMAFEGCSETAITKVVIIEKVIYVCIYSTSGMRERHIEDEQEAMNFAKTVKGAVCPLRLKMKRGQPIPVKH